MAKKIKPISRIVKIEREINRIVGEAFLRRDPVGIEEGWVPCMDISEKEDEVTVKVEVPGLQEKDMTILLHSNRMEIKGIKNEIRSKGKVKYLRLEREYGSFKRLVFLPSVVIPEKAKAMIENGILTVKLKKPKQKIDEEFVLKIKKS